MQIISLLTRLFYSIIYKHYKAKLIFNDPKKYLIDSSNKNISKPIFLLGTASGGLSIIRRIISRHPNIVYCTGDYKYFHYVDEINHYYKKFVPKTFNISNIVSKKKFPPFNLYAIDKYINKAIIKKKDFYLSSLKYLKLLNAIFKIYSNDPSKDRIIDKSQNNSLNIKFLDYTFKGKKPTYILIVNNPYAVIAKNYINLKKKSKSKNNLDISIQHYSNLVKKCIKDLKKSQNKYIILYFDDFLKNPEKTMRKIFSFLNLNFENKFMPNRDNQYLVRDYKWYPIRKQTHRHYLKILSKNDLKKINNRCNYIFRTLKIKKINQFT